MYYTIRYLSRRLMIVSSDLGAAIDSDNVRKSNFDDCNFITRLLSTDSY